MTSFLSGGSGTSPVRRPGPGDEVDVVVVGAGPSGLSAASWAARYRRSVVVLDSGEHRADRVEQSHGYLGRDPQVPRDLLRQGRAEVLAYPRAAVCDRAVESVGGRVDGLFRVGLAGGGELVGHRVVLACGVRDATPDIDGFEEHYGASAFHCPSCDGYEARDRDVVCLGWDEHVTGFATQLLGWARSVTVVTDGHRFPGDDRSRELLDRHGVAVLEDEVAALVGPRGGLEAVRLRSGRRLRAALFFFSIAHEPRNGLALALGCETDEHGLVTVNDCGMTTVPGVYACGDLVPGLQLTAVAAASGVVAGVAAAQSLFGERGAPTSPLPAPDVSAELEAAID